MSTPYRVAGAPNLDGLALASGLFDPALAIGNASSVLVDPAGCGGRVGRAYVLVRSFDITTTGDPMLVKVYKVTNANNATPGEWLVIQKTANAISCNGAGGWMRLPIDPDTGEPWRLRVETTGATAAADLAIDFDTGADR